MAALLAEEQSAALFIECVGSRDGTMGPSELQLVLDRFGKSLDQSQADALLVQLDRDQDGVVTLADFCAAMKDFASTFGGGAEGMFANEHEHDDARVDSTSVLGEEAARLRQHSPLLLGAAAAEGAGEAAVTSQTNNINRGGGDDAGAGADDSGDHNSDDDDVLGDLDRSRRRKSSRFGTHRLSGGGGDDEAREYIASSLRDATGIKEVELRDVMSLVDDLVAAECADLEAAIDEAKVACDRATDSKRQVEERLQALSDEFSQQDAELTAAASYRRLCDERLQQNNLLQLEISKLRDEIADLAAGEQTAKAIAVERNKLRQTVTTQKQQMLEQLEKQQTTEVALANSMADFEALQEERDSLLQEFHCVLDQVKDQGVSVQFEAGQLGAENLTLREELRALEATLASKEAAVERYKSQLDDQTLLVQSLHAERSANGEQTGYTGSLMNEIEHLVMAQIENNPNSSSNTDAGNGTPAEAAGKPDVDSPSVAPKPAAPTAADDADGDADGGNPFPATSAASGAGPSEQGENAGKLPVSAPSSPLRKTQDTSAIMQDRLQVYAAASAHHLSGRKVITPDMAAEMDIPSLLKTAAALQDLIDTRSSRLIDALAEREWLETDIRVKNSFVKFYVQKAASEASPKTKLTKSSASAASTPRRKNSGSKSSSMFGNLMTPISSRLNFWGSSAPAARKATATATKTPPPKMAPPN